MIQAPKRESKEKAFQQLKSMLELVDHNESNEFNDYIKRRVIFSATTLSSLLKEEGTAHVTDNNIVVKFRNSDIDCKPFVICYFSHSPNTKL